MLKNAVLRASRVLDYVAAVAMLAILLVTCASVASRALLDRPIAGALESSMLLMPVVVFGGMAWVFARVGHFAMSSIVEARGGLLKPIGLVLQIALGGIVFVMLSVESVELVERSFLRGEYFAGPVNIPVYYSRFAIAVGSIVTAAAIFAVLLPDSLSLLRRRRGEGDEG